tara:strand:+ start:1164 stop:1742 length:579 start_codon:yes stop_codon:yes gene_type:complete
MSKWKNIKTYMEVNPYTGQPIDEDMPTNAAGRGAVAGIGVGPDGEPGYDPKKKKRKRTLIDARSKSYRQHRERLEKARAKREEKKSKLAQKVTEDTLNFEREKHLEEAELDEVRISDYVVDTLRNIKRSKSSRNLKLKGGDIKIDTETANKMLDFLDNMTSPMGKRKIIDILDKGTKKDFMKVNQAVMKAVK